MSHPELILASTSRYRRAMLENLGLTVRTEAPETDETPIPGESPVDLALRLGEAKARSVAGRLSRTGSWLVIGSDQVCHLDGEVFGKPGSEDNARAMLHRFSGRTVSFTTSLALIADSGWTRAAVETCEAAFRPLTAAVIDRYLALDRPLDCAGAIKVEKRGIALLKAATGRDINTLYGLPLILLTDFLDQLGYTVFDFNNTI